MVSLLGENKLRIKRVEGAKPLWDPVGTVSSLNKQQVSCFWHRIMLGLVEENQRCLCNCSREREEEEEGRE